MKLVSELKDEYTISSFEEFMKTYESDGDLNYADLNSGSIGEVKGYGPCYKDCGYGVVNPTCVIVIRI